MTTQRWLAAPTVVVKHRQVRCKSPDFTVKVAVPISIREYLWNRPIIEQRPVLATRRYRKSQVNLLPYGI